MLKIGELRECYQTDKEANYKSLMEYKEAMRYYHGEQLPPEALMALEERGQQPIIENIYKMIVNKILGYKIQASQEIRVFGRNEESKNKAELLQEILRSINQSKIYDRELHLRDRDLLFGLGILEVWVVKDKEDNNQITLKHINADSFLIDKYSTDLNALDATRFHKTLNINEAQGMDFEIQPAWDRYKFDKRATLIESWIKGCNGWDRYIWHTHGQVYKFETRPFLNGAHPYVVSKFAQDHEYRWYGIFRDLKPIQDYINIAENRIANMLGGSVKAFVEESAILDLEDFTYKLARDNVVIRLRDQALQSKKIHFVEHHAEVSSLSQKVAEKRNLAKILSGLNEEALGMATNRQSGVAIAQRRDAGLMGLQTYVMQTDISDRILYEKMIDLIQHYYTKPQLFRITDNKNITRYFDINTTEENKIEVGQYDLIYTTQLKQTGREERFAHWTELLKTISQARPDIITSLLPMMLKDTDSPVVKDIEEVLAQIDAQAQEAASQTPPPDPLSEAEIALKQAEAQKTLAHGEYMQAKTQLLQNAEAVENVDPKIRKQMQLSSYDLR